MASQLDKIIEDRDVAEPFFNRILQRAREKHPDLDIRVEDISITVSINTRTFGSGNPELLKQAHQLLNDIIKEGVSI